MTAGDIAISILFDLLLASITILLFLFSFLVIFNNFFMIPVVKENNKLKLALALSTGTPIIFVKK